MDLNYTPEDVAYRKQVRAWLEENLPREEIRTLDDRRRWHRKLYEAGYLGMGWPKEYGGAGARPMEQAIVADEMARVNAPAPDQRPGPRHRRAHHRGARHRRAEEALPPEDPHGGGALVPALLRAQCRLRPRRAQDQRRRRGRPLRRQRPEDLDVERRRRRLGTPPRPHRHQGGQAQGHLVLPHEHAPARRRRAPAQADHRLVGVLRGLHDQRARGEGRSDRQARRGLGHRADDARLRARRPRAGARHQLCSRSTTGSSRRRAGSSATAQAAHRRSPRAPEARAHLGRPRGRALRRAPHADHARARRAPGRGRLADQAVLLGAREALHGSRHGDPRPLRPAHGRRARGVSTSRSTPRWATAARGPTRSCGRGRARSTRARARSRRT